MTPTSRSTGSSHRSRGGARGLAWPVAAVGLAAAALAFAASQARRKTGELRSRLEAARIRIPEATYADNEFGDLPAPVQRYFRIALKPGQRMISAASLCQVGSFRPSLDATQWKPFSADQRIVARRPGFVWDARFPMLPGATMHVRDAYVAGEGILEVSLWGLVPLAASRGTPEAARGELIRFLAEAAWYPTALLPSQGVRWQAVDAVSANATLGDGDTEVTLLFTFDSAGLIESARAEARGAAIGKTVVMMPWEGRWAEHQMRDGMLVPTQGEAAWLTPQGRKVYWRGSVTRIVYEFEPSALPVGGRP